VSKENHKDRLEELQDGLDAFGEATGTKGDRLEEVEPIFQQVDADPFDMYLLHDRHKGITEETYNQWVNTYDQWKDFMIAQGRHPACPSKIHVSKFVEFQTEDLGYTEGDVKSKLYHLNACYQWMQEEGRFPIPTDYNPFGPWLKKGVLSPSTGKKNYPRISLDELQERVTDIKNIRERAIVVTQLKLGCRSGELANIRLSEIDIEHPEAKKHYEEMGTHPLIDQHENVVVIPADRKGNKRKVDTILPLDEETRQAIVDWLLIRPDNGKDEVFFTDKGKPLTTSTIGYMWSDKYWTDHQYEKEEYYDSITPHWCRHHFTTWWAQTNLPADQRKYMRGDKTDEFNKVRGAMDLYIHQSFEDIEQAYRDGIFPLRLEKP
jgi:integrase/recombinase XerD